MANSFSVKLKSKKGQIILKELSNTTTIGQLKNLISEKTDIKVPRLHILVGFPPRPLDLTNNNINLLEGGVKSGDTLIVEEKAIQPSIEDDEALARRLQAEEEAKHLREVVRQNTRQENTVNERDRITSNDINESPPSFIGYNYNGDFDGILLKKVVAADNSCLFTSVRFVLNGKIDNEGSEIMRHIIAQQVSADPNQYNDAILGKSNSEYCRWIQKPESWGGAIEVAILSNYYGIEIDVVDIQNAIINRFGEDKNYTHRVFLLFDGIHYDPLYMEPARGGQIATIFPVEEMNIYHQAEQLANEAKSARQYTNVEKFTLRCLQCDVKLSGQIQAQEHAKETGHQRFGEI